MGEQGHIESGTPVYSADGRELGTVKEHWGETLYFGNQSISVEMIDCVLAQGVYLKDSYTAGSPAGDSFDEDVIRVATRGEDAVIAQEAALHARRNEREREA